MRVAFLKPPIGGILGLEMLTFVEPLGPICVAGVSSTTVTSAGSSTCASTARSTGSRAAGVRARHRRACSATSRPSGGALCAWRGGVKGELPETFVLVGGHDASRDPSGSAIRAVDAVAVGDGEEVMPAMVDALERRDRSRESPGPASCQRDGALAATGHAPARRELDDLPLPARHLIAEYAPHYYINFRKPLALHGDGARLPVQVQLLLGVEVPRVDLPREVAGASGARAPGDRRAERLHHRRHLLADVQRGEELAKQIKAAGIRSTSRCRRAPTSSASSRT